MKKLLTLLAVMIVVLGTLFTPTTAAPTADLNALAKYFPASAPVLVSFRTDDAYIKEIDDLFAKIAAQIPGMKQPEKIADQFDQAVKTLTGGDFQSDVRSWLGDTASIGLFSFDGMMGRGSSDGKSPHFLAAVAITDQKAAETFWKTALDKASNGKYESSTEGDFTLFIPSKDAPRSASGIVAIGQDVMLIAAYQEDLALAGQNDPLSESATFTDSISLLPAEDYNITIYTNLGDLFKQVMAMQSEMMGSNPAQAAMMKNLAPFLEKFPPEIIGFTVLDERSLTIDFAVPYGDLLAEAEKAGFSTAMPVPVNPAFAANILSGSPLVLHSTNLGASLEGVLKNFQAQAGMMPSSSGMSADELKKNLDQINKAVLLFTKKDLEKDILPAMTGDYALYVTLNPALSDVSSGSDLMKQLPVDFGFLTEMNDATIAPAIMDGIKMAFTMSESKDTKLTTETIGGVDALVITSTPKDSPFPIELVITGNDKLFFFGTRRAAEAALTGTGGLDKDASFQEAAGYMVTSPSVVAYLASEGLKPLSKIISLTSGKSSGEQFGAFLKLLSSASISSSTQDNVGYGRVVWTLPR